MERIEFHEVLTEFEKSFGAFSDIRRNRIYYHCQHLSIESFRKICVAFIDQDLKPGVNHFKSKAKAYVDVPPEFEPEEIDCPHCYNSGKVFVETNRQDNFYPAMSCNCSNRDKFWGLPVWDNDFKLKNFWDDLKKSNTDGIYERAEKFKAYIKKSKKIWEGEL